GGKWMAARRPPGALGVPAAVGRQPPPLPDYATFLVPSGGLWRRVTRRGLFWRPAGAGPDSQDLAIWLILPVVICLSQRLSHACLSISTLYCETANGSLNQLSFI